MQIENIKNIEKEADELYTAWRDKNSELNELRCEKYKDKWLNKFIKYWEGTLDDPEYKYMFVHDIWWSSNSGDDGIYIEGMGFSSRFTEYLDMTFANWSEFVQEHYRVYDIENVNTSFYHIEVIDKEEYDKAFKEMVENLIKEHENFDYEKYAKGDEA